MEIRLARPSEADELTALAHRAKAAWGYPSEWMSRWRGELTFTADYIATHRAFVGVEGDAAVATCVLEDFETHWSIEHLWVSPEHQGEGIGRAMVEHARRHAQESRPGPIEVLSDPNAEAFYRRLGAERVGAEPAPMPGAPDRTLPKLRFAEA